MKNGTEFLNIFNALYTGIRSIEVNYRMQLLNRSRTTKIVYSIDNLVNAWTIIIIGKRPKQISYGIHLSDSDSTLTSGATKFIKTSSLGF